METFPSPNDYFAGWANRMGELQAEAYKIEYGWNEIYIVRPANVYGPWDNFDPNNAMVIPSIIKRATDGENPLKVWGDGSAIRDFIHSRDCAKGMIQVFEKGITKPFKEELFYWSYEPLKESERIAGILSSRILKQKNE